jgi:hypothetical protein
MLKMLSGIAILAFALLTAGNAAAASQPGHGHAHHDDPERARDEGDEHNPRQGREPQVASLLDDSPG